MPFDEDIAVQEHVYTVLYYGALCAWLSTYVCLRVRGMLYIDECLFITARVLQEA